MCIIDWSSCPFIVIFFQIGPDEKSRVKRKTLDFIKDDN